jgi:hypothetical protein
MCTSTKRREIESSGIGVVVILAGHGSPLNEPPQSLDPVQVRRVQQADRRLRRQPLHDRVPLVPVRVAAAIHIRHFDKGEEVNAVTRANAVSRVKQADRP